MSNLYFLRQNKKEKKLYGIFYWEKCLIPGMYPMYFIEWMNKTVSMAGKSRLEIGFMLNRLKLKRLLGATFGAQRENLH